MRYIFIDNFRGFANTVLPLLDVNFFVGENSTGKTSILALFKMMSEPSFWFRSTFYDEQVELGNFEDIVSVASSNRTYFRVGLIELTQNSEKESTPVGCIMTFTEKKGVPFLSHFSSVNGRTHVHIRFGPKSIRYSFQDNAPIQNSIEAVTEMFTSISALHEHDEGSYGILKNSGYREPLPFLMSRLENHLNKKHHDAKLHIYEPSFQQIAWLAPIRSKPLRTYESYKLEFSPEGTHTPLLIRTILSSRKSAAQKFSESLRKFGESSGLFEGVRIKKFGRDSISPFELDITLNVNVLSIKNVGYGVSQILPIVVELLARSKDSWFAIQQPEVHLHPRAQAAFGEFLFELAVQENKKFIIETHSDYCIDSFRYSYKNKTSRNKPHSQIVFFERTSNGNILHCIPILDTGELPDTQPESYRSFFIGHQIRVLGI